VIVAGDPVALLTTEMLPFTLPAVVGLNCTTRVMLWVGVSVTGAPPPVIEYPAPVKLICEIVTLELPVLVIVTFCVGEEVPVVTFPKLKPVGGLMPRVRTAAILVPLRGTDVGDVGALLTIEMLPETVPTVVGRKAAVIVVCCPAFTLSGNENPLTLKPEPVAVI
jgi:hypothetical protein